MITRYSLRNYMRSLVDRFFKILPLWEDGEETLPTYLDSMLVELSGFRSMMFALHHDQDYVTLIAILQYLIDNPDTTPRTVRREVFRAISICNKLSAKYGTKEGFHKVWEAQHELTTQPGVSDESYALHEEVSE